MDEDSESQCDDLEVCAMVVESDSDIAYDS